MRVFFMLFVDGIRSRILLNEPGTELVIPLSS